MKQIADSVMSTAKDVTEGKFKAGGSTDDKPLAARLDPRKKGKLGEQCHSRKGSTRRRSR